MSSITDRVNILSYDFSLRPPGTKNSTNDFKEERLSNFTHYYLSFYDIICFQEVFAFGSTRRARLIGAANKNGLPYVKASYVPCFLMGMDGGLLILSRYPIVRSNELTFSNAFQKDAYKHKGCLYAKMNVRENFHIHVFNTNLQTRCTGDLVSEDKASEVRMQQLTELRNFMVECLVSKPSGEPVFLMGNFNINSRMSGYENNSHSSPDYHAMIQLLAEGPSNSGEKSDLLQSNSYYNFKDLLFEKLKYHPITYADSFKGAHDEIIPRETCLTSPLDLNTMQSLDYFFQIDENIDKETPKNTFTFEVTSVKIEELIYDEHAVKLPIAQLSDHYGISARILIKRK